MRASAVADTSMFEELLERHLEPRLARAQIVLHAGQQFLECDVLKWWHRAPGGGTGVAQRTKALEESLAQLVFQQELPREDAMTRALHPEDLDALLKAKGF